MRKLTAQLLISWILFAVLCLNAQAAGSRDGLSAPQRNKPDGGKRTVKIINPDEQLFMVKKDGKFGYITRDGTLAIPCQYEQASPFAEGLASVMAAGKWGFIDGTGKMLGRPLYEKVDDFSDGLAAVNLAGKFGYINKQGSMVIKPQFDRAERFSEGLAAVLVGDRWGYIDKLGRFVIKPQFFRASDFQNGLAVVMMFRDDEMFNNAEQAMLGYVNRRGEFVWRPTR